MKLANVISLVLLFIIVLLVNNNAFGHSYADKNPVIAHRGAWKKNGLPQNSIASLKEAIRLGCAGAEFDVRMTLDDSLIINHDPTYNDKVIDQSTYAELEKYRLANGENLPGLREYILAGIANNTQTKLICEIKPSDVSKARAGFIAEKIMHLVNELAANKMLVFISFDYDILKKILQINPNAVTQYLEGDRSPDQLKQDGITGADFHLSVYQEHPEWIDIAKKNKIVLNAWTVNEAADMDWLLARGFDFITTNEPELLFQQLNKLSDPGNKNLTGSDKIETAGLPIIDHQKIQSDKKKQKKIFDENKLGIRWELITNEPKTLSTFTITNNSNRDFPATGWTIYFNSSREMDAAAATEGVNILHVNGDIYKIVPTASFKAIKPKKALKIQYLSNGLLINYTAAPCCLYIVWDNDPGNGYSISDFVIAPLKNTTKGLVTAEKIYQQNSIIKDIPVSQLPKIFPTPVFYKESDGAFLLDREVNIETDELFKKEAAYLSDELNVMLGKKHPGSAGNENGNKIIFKKSAMANEAYRLSVTNNRIVISASSGAGVFYGIQSLRSLMPASSWNGIQTGIKIPIVEVQDEPRFGYRSFMLDVARNFKSKADIFRILNLMAFYKMNVFHFHFSDDEGWRIEIPSLPELTDIGSNRGYTPDSKKMLPASYGSGPVPGKTLGSGYYTKNDFIEILKYANDRHIQVIPEIESPGHSRAAIKAMDARYDRFMQLGNSKEAERFMLRDINDKSVYHSAQEWTDNVICVGLPSVYNFIEKVVDEFVLMYKEAGVPLATIHLGGDEVPSGAWVKSPVCQQLINKDSLVKETDDLWYYFYSRINKIIQSKGLFLSGWEETGMRKTLLDGVKAMIVNPRFANDNIQLHVWNNVVGWGSEDLPYRLANAGYKVVLSPASNNYIDLAYYKSADEPGYYWAGFQDIDKPFYFIPFDYYKTIKEDSDGNPVGISDFIGKDRLTDFGKSNIVGIEGLLWSENVRSTDQLEYLLLPKLLGVAERAWAKDPEWAITKDKIRYQQLYNEAWSIFVNVVGKIALPVLDHFSGGFKYRIPTAGAMVENGKVLANLQLPGLTIRYTTDGSEPTYKSSIYEVPLSVKGIIKIKVFDQTGRSGRITEIENK